MYTVVIASLAGEPLLVEALQSVGAQSLPPVRTLVVCDAGADIPDDWARALDEALPGVEITHSDGRGMVPAINHGIAACVTPYIAFLDADDLWQPEKQRHQLAALDGDPAIDAVTGGAANFTLDADGDPQLQPAQPSIMFTASTFRRDTFDRYGALDVECTHFTWLYRWWGQARARDIRTRGLDYVGLWRRLHEANSWRTEAQTAHRDLLGEVRRHVQRGRTR